jgi:hypothetical protein
MTDVAEKGQPKPLPVYRDLWSYYLTTINPASTTTTSPHITEDARLQFKLDTSAARDSSFDDDNIQEKKREETLSLKSTNCSCSRCLGSSSRKQNNHAFTLVDGPGSSSNGHAMKISNDAHFGDGWDPDFGEGWSITGRMDYLGGRILWKKEAQMVAAILWQYRGLYAILSTSPAYYLANCTDLFFGRTRCIPWLRFPISDGSFHRQNSFFFGMTPKLPMWQTTVASYVVHVCVG